MQVHKTELPYKYVYILPIGDCHRGSKEFREDVLDTYLQWVDERDNAYILLGGDLGEYPTRTSVTNPWEVDSPTQLQMAWEEEKFMPFKDKILGVIQGNHENRVFDHSGIDPSMVLASRLGVPYGRHGLYLSIGLTYKKGGDNHRFTVYATHGWGGARKAGAKVLKVEELAHAIHANVYFMFHDHFIATHRIAYKIPSDNHKEIVDYRKVLLNCGSFLGYGGYAQSKGYSPVDLGTPRVRVEKKRGTTKGILGKRAYYDVHVSI